MQHNTQKRIGILALLALMCQFLPTMAGTAYAEEDTLRLTLGNVPAVTAESSALIYVGTTSQHGVLSCEMSADGLSWKLISCAAFQMQLPTPGIHTALVRVTDVRGESRIATARVERVGTPDVGSLLQVSDPVTLTNVTVNKGERFVDGHRVVMSWDAASLPQDLRCFAQLDSGPAREVDCAGNVAFPLPLSKTDPFAIRVYTENATGNQSEKVSSQELQRRDTTPPAVLAFGLAGGSKVAYVNTEEQTQVQVFVHAIDEAAITCYVGTTEEEAQKKTQKLAGCHGEQQVQMQRGFGSKTLYLVAEDVQENMSAPMGITFETLPATSVYRTLQREGVCVAEMAFDLAVLERDLVTSTVTLEVRPSAMLAEEMKTRTAVLRAYQTLDSQTYDIDKSSLGDGAIVYDQEKQVFVATVQLAMDTPLWTRNGTMVTKQRDGAIAFAIDGLVSRGTGTVMSPCGMVQYGKDLVLQQEDRTDPYIAMRPDGMTHMLQKGEDIQLVCADGQTGCQSLQVALTDDPRAESCMEPSTNYTACTNGACRVPTKTHASLCAVATDAAGNAVRKHVVLPTDTQKPQISGITLLSEQGTPLVAEKGIYHAFGEYVRIRFTPDDTHGKPLTCVFGATSDMCMPGTTIVQQTLLRDGENSIDLRVVDAAGNMQQVRYTVVTDDVDPTLAGELRVVPNSSGGFELSLPVAAVHNGQLAYTRLSMWHNQRMIPLKLGMLEGNGYTIQDGYAVYPLHHDGTYQEHVVFRPGFGSLPEHAQVQWKFEAVKASGRLVSATSPMVVLDTSAPDILAPADAATTSLIKGQALPLSIIIRDQVDQSSIPVSNMELEVVDALGTLLEKKEVCTQWTKGASCTVDVALSDLVAPQSPLTIRVRDGSQNVREVKHAFEVTEPVELRALGDVRYLEEGVMVREPKMTLVLDAADQDRVAKVRAEYMQQNGSKAEAMAMPTDGVVHLYLPDIREGTSDVVLFMYDKQGQAFYTEGLKKTVATDFGAPEIESGLLYTWTQEQGVELTIPKIHDASYPVFANGYTRGNAGTEERTPGETQILASTFAKERTWSFPNISSDSGLKLLVSDSAQRMEGEKAIPASYVGQHFFFPDIAVHLRATSSGVRMSYTVPMGVSPTSLQNLVVRLVSNGTVLKEDRLETVLRQGTLSAWYPAALGSVELQVALQREGERSYRGQVTVEPHMIQPHLRIVAITQGGRSAQAHEQEYIVSGSDPQVTLVGMIDGNGGGREAFPITLKATNGETTIVREILSPEEIQESTFAFDFPMVLGSAQQMMLIARNALGQVQYAQARVIHDASAPHMEYKLQQGGEIQPPQRYGMIPLAGTGALVLETTIRGETHDVLLNVDVQDESGATVIQKEQRVIGDDTVLVQLENIQENIGYKVRLMSQDVAGNSSTMDFWIKQDTQAPEVMGSVQLERMYSIHTIPLSGLLVRDALPVSIELMQNGKLLKKQPFHGGFSLPDGTYNALSMRFVDAAGNSTSPQTLPAFTIDGTPPAGDIQFVENQDTVAVSVKQPAEGDAVRYIVTRDYVMIQKGDVPQVQGDHLLANVALAQGMSNHIRVSLLDTFGNILLEEQAYPRGLAAPEVTSVRWMEVPQGTVVELTLHTSLYDTATLKSIAIVDEEGKRVSVADEQEVQEGRVQIALPLGIEMDTLWSIESNITFGKDSSISWSSGFLPPEEETPLMEMGDIVWAKPELLMTITQQGVPLCEMTMPVRQMYSYAYLAARCQRERLPAGVLTVSMTDGVDTKSRDIEVAPYYFAADGDVNGDGRLSLMDYALLRAYEERTKNSVAKIIADDIVAELRQTMLLVRLSYQRSFIDFLQ